MDTYRVGAVAYDPRVVTIWEAFRRWFEGRGFPVDHTLYATYEAQTEALFRGEIDTAWNTNLAYVRTRLRSAACRPIAMRDNDRGWISHVVTLPGAPRGLDGLRGKRIGFGDRDSPQACILPLHALRVAGLEPGRDFAADRLDRDLGKHGDTGGAELAQLERLRAGALDASILSAPTLAGVRAAGADDLEVAWSTPPFSHCNFTVLNDAATHDRFAALLFDMDAADDAVADAMRLEWVTRWVPCDGSGYDDLTAAVTDG